MLSLSGKETTGEIYESLPLIWFLFLILQNTSELSRNKKLAMEESYSRPWKNPMEMVKVSLWNPDER